MAEEFEGNADLFAHATLTQAMPALESLRESGLDLSAAVGELVDNAFQGGASHIRIATVRDASRSIVQLGCADDGFGIPRDELPRVLSLGYSSSYNERDGLGRFGFGLKIASLSQARRVEVYSRVRASEGIFTTHLDLGLIQTGEQRELPVAPSQWPQQFAHLMRDPATDKPLSSGTLIVWRETDRLHEGGRFGTAAEEKMQGLRRFLARAYRRFIDNGLKIELDGKEITLHDPLFMLDNPRVAQSYPEVSKAEIIEADELDIDGHKVKWTVTLLPKHFREKPDQGARASKGRAAFADLHIPYNESKISVLRNGREIYYGQIPNIYPSGQGKVDRFIGVEIEFPAALDEYFQVRNVKAGAEPGSKLREELRRALERPIKRARKSIRAHWTEVQKIAQVKAGYEHFAAHVIFDAFEQTAPAGRANLDATAQEVGQALTEIAALLGLDPDDPRSAKKVSWVRESLDRRAVTIVNGQWPGKALLDIKHLSGKAVVTVNDGHPIVEELMRPLKAMAELDIEELDSAEVSNLLNRLSVGIDLLLMAYAKAESMHADPDVAYRELRSFWGVFGAGLVREAGRVRD